MTRDFNPTRVKNGDYRSEKQLRRPAIAPAQLLRPPFMQA
jgi:hypothetical protein